MSTYRYAKKVHMYQGSQSVEFNPLVGGNLAHIESVASGHKTITLSDLGDVVVMDEQNAVGNSVSIIGGAGDDSIFVRDGAVTTLDASEGGADKVITYADAGARVTIAGYQASTGAGVKIDELGTANMFDAIAGTSTAKPMISFGDGVISITHPSYDNHSEVYIGQNDGASFVNLYNYKNEVQSVGFTGSEGGTLNAENETDPLILVGDYYGNKDEGSVILGGKGPDTILAGSNDSVDAKGGNNLVRLQDDPERDGAVIALTEGRTTIENMNNTLAGSTGDSIVMSVKDLKSLKYDGENVTVDGDGFYGIIADADEDETYGGYTTQYFYNSDNGQTYKAAIAEKDEIIVVDKDDDMRPNAFYGENSGVSFLDYPEDSGLVSIDLKGDMLAQSSIGGAPAYFSGITQLYGADTKADLIFKGSDANETLFAGLGNTSLYGDGGRNLLVGAYSAEVSAKEGHTTFFVIGNANGAANTISNFEYVTDDNYKDTSKVTADEIEILEEQSEVVYADLSNNDVYIEVRSLGGENTESVLLEDAIDSDGYGKDFRISGNVAQVGRDKVLVDRFAEFYMATEKNATINVDDDVNPITVWLDNPETGKTFRGDFAVIDASGTTADAQLVARGGKDSTIIAGSGNTSMWGGEGGNDWLVGGDGKDTFFYGKGNGQDTIVAGEGDTVVLGISLDDLTDDYTIADDGISFTLNDGGKVTVIDNGADIDYKVGEDTYTFSHETNSFKQKP